MLDLFKTFVPHPEIACSKAEFDPAIHKATYKYNYPALFKKIASCPAEEGRSILHSVCLNDRFFLAYFVSGWEVDDVSGNKPFIVNACNMLDSEVQTDTVDVWAREHGKSTLITVCGTVQRILNDPECTTAIFSYKKGASDKFLDSIRKMLESEFLVWLFPEILSSNISEYSIWSINGLRVKRKNKVLREHTVEAFGLVDGMPTGGHWKHLIWDDIETDDMAQSPDQMDLCFSKLQMSYNLGKEGGTNQIIGTYYSHFGVLVKLGAMKKFDGDLMYKIRIFPGTDDGTINGKPVFFTQAYLDSKKTRPGFNTQILCNPTPTNDIRLDFNRFKKISRKDLPKDRIKFIVIDPAGDKEAQSGTKNDNWAMLVLSVRPFLDELGTSDVYLEGGVVSTLSRSQSNEAAASLYMSNGRITMLGIERVGTESAHTHILNYLAANGRYLSEHKKGRYDGGNWMQLSPSARTKNMRIEQNLAWPLNNGKLHIVDDLDESLVERLKEECNKFPFFHVDMIDAFAYLYDIMADGTIMFSFALESDTADDEGYLEEEVGRSEYGGY